jgi:PST family polysaccharide transporter
MTTNASFKEILRSSSIIGGASVVNILIGLLRTKVAAVILGPAGVGLIALLQNVLSLFAAVAGLGIANSAVRQLAQGSMAEDNREIRATRRALFWGTAFLAVLGGGSLWLFRSLVAEHVLGDPSQARNVGWLSIGVTFTVISASQVALLNGLRRIGDIARVSVYGALIGTVLGVAALLLWREAGVTAYLIAAPFAAVVSGSIITRRVRLKDAHGSTVAELRTQLLGMLGLGFTLMLVGLTATLSLLAVRTVIGKQLGAVALGEFSAAWMISMTYIGFVLQAMGTDYYPRLSAVIGDDAAATRLVNEQSEVALLLAGPILLMMQASAPWLVQLLFSSEFTGAVDVLRWQILGDVLKIIGWPLGFVILASGSGRLFLTCDALGVVIYSGFVWAGISTIGISSAGVGFMLMYAAYLPVVYVIARRKIGFHWAPRVAWSALTLTGAVGLTGLLGDASKWTGLLAGTGIAIASACYSIRRLHQLEALQGIIVPLLNLIARVRGTSVRP